MAVDRKLNLLSHTYLIYITSK